MLKSRGISPLFLIFVEVLYPALVSLPETKIGRLATFSSNNACKRIPTPIKTKFCKIIFWVVLAVVVDFHILTISDKMSSV